MAFKKGEGGRKKGAGNLLSKEQRHVIHDAFELLGGVGALKRWGLKNRSEFYSLWGKTIPRTVEGDLQHTGKLTITIERK